MLSKPKSFSHDIGVDLCWRSVAVVEHVVLVVQLGETSRQGQLVPEALVNAEGQLARGQLAGQRSGGKCSYGGFVSCRAAG